MNQAQSLKLSKSGSKAKTTRLPYELPIDTQSEIVHPYLSQTDFCYNQNGTSLAVADSEGHVFIYERNYENYSKIVEFQADQASIWKVAWSDLEYNLLAICSFKKKVAIYQQQHKNREVWVQIAWHQLHEGSVNTIDWFGLKLFAGGNDGLVSILEVKNNKWESWSFKAQQTSINCIAVQPIPLNQQQKLRDTYPFIATISKGMNLKVWHYGKITESSEDQEGSGINKLFKEKSMSDVYNIMVDYKVPGDNVRTLLWRPRWFADSFVELILCSQDGKVKILRFNKSILQSQTTVCELNEPINRIAQSLTGNLIAISLAGKDQQKHQVFREIDCNKWEQVQELQ